MYEAIVVCFVVCLVFFTCMFFMDLCGLIQINDDDESRPIPYAYAIIQTVL